MLSLMIIEERLREYNIKEEEYLKVIDKTNEVETLKNMLRQVVKDFYGMQKCCLILF